MWYLYAAVAAILYLMRRPKIFKEIWLAEQIPGPLSLPIVGNAWVFFNLSIPGSYQNNNRISNRITIKYSIAPAADTFTMFEGWMTKYGNMIRCWIMDELFVIICHPIEAELVMNNTTHLEKSSIYSFLHDWLRTGLLTATGRKWHQRRKILTPAFHFQILEQYVEVFDRQSSVLCECLQQPAPTDRVNTLEYVQLMTLDTMCETSMGVSIDAQRNSDQAYVRAVKR